MTKNTCFVIALMFFGFGCVQAQQNMETGPLAKNRKPWKDPKPQTTIYLKKHEDGVLTGPLAKNRKIWKDEYVVTPMVWRTRKELTGPWAKNARPERGNYWEDDNL
ncbi:MAG: hypothetical protein CMH46_06010 [Muricauda sp.]|nr:MULTISPECIES: hypothetical protein [unclassified Allomuricauda]MAU15079.1 hypothetical protein [Allomuricauda sp.]